MTRRLRSFFSTFRFPVFDSAEQERVFWIERDRRRCEFRKFFLICGILITAMMGSLDLILGGEATKLLLAIRAVEIFVMVYLFYRFLKASTAIGREWILVGFGIVFLTSAAIMTLVGPNDVARLYPYLFFCCLIFGSCLLVPRFYTQSAFCLFASLVYWPLNLLVGTPMGDLFINSFLMIITLLAVAIGSLVREQLEREHAISEDRLVSARDEAVRAARAKSYLLANVSHELRTPLNAIIGFSEVINNETFGKIPQPQYREYIRDIHYSGHLLHTNINDLLDISRMEVDKMSWTDDDFSLSEILAKVVNACTVNADAVAITLSDRLLAHDISMRGDPDRMSQAFINIITNVVKFSEAGKSVVIDIVDDEDHFGLSITDEGCGIAEADFAQILEPFGQVKRSVYEATNKGLGLGLTIVQGIMEKCGGSFGITSEVNVGTTVTLMIPSDRISMMPSENTDGARGLFSAGRKPRLFVANG